MIALFATLLAVVTAPYAPVSYACDGSTANFTINFPYLSSSDLTVTSTTGGGTVTTLSLTTDYTTNVVSTTSTAVLTILVPATKCPSGSTLKISRTMACTQPQVFRQQTSFDPRLVETASDRVLMCAQQVQAQVAGTQNVNFAGNNTFVGLQTFTSGNAIDGPVMLTPQASDPTTPANGEAWVNSTSNVAKIRLAGVTQQITTSPISGNPFFHGESNSGQSITNAAPPSSTIVLWTSITDTDSGYNAGTGKYAIPAGKGGSYFFSCTITWNGTVSAEAFPYIDKNGSEAVRSDSNSATANQSQTVTAILQLVAGDLVACRVAQVSAGAVTLRPFFQTNHFSIKRLSD